MDISNIYPQFTSVKKWRVRSKSDPSKIYDVEKMADGSFKCNCMAGQMRRTCWHTAEIRKQIIWEDGNEPNRK